MYTVPPEKRYTSCLIYSGLLHHFPQVKVMENKLAAKIDDASLVEDGKAPLFNFRGTLSLPTAVDAADPPLDPGSRWRNPVFQEPVEFIYFTLFGHKQIIAQGILDGCALGFVPHHQAEDMAKWLDLGLNLCGRVLPMQLSVVGYGCREVHEYMVEWEGYVEWI